MIKNANVSDAMSIVEYLKEVPFDVSRSELYDAKELYEGFDPADVSSFDDCHDTRIYQHYLAHGKQTNDIKESMARTLHDHSIYVALRQIVFLCKRLTEAGFYVLSGGGPGAMEATHLGAWMAGYGDADAEDALKTLSAAPSFRDAGWLTTAFEVLQRYPQTTYDSLSIPTWLYGHEPSTPFATHIAKFFENSIRENNILTLPFGGIVYTPGSAGTMQEIFQDAVQNHYLSFGFSSPMIFLGKQFWTEDIPVYSLLHLLTEKGKYNNLSLLLTDEVEEVMEELIKFQQRVKEHPEEFQLK